MRKDKKKRIKKLKRVRIIPHIIIFILCITFFVMMVTVTEAAILGFIVTTKYADNNKETLQIVNEIEKQNADKKGDFQYEENQYIDATFYVYDDKGNIVYGTDNKQLKQHDYIEVDFGGDEKFYIDPEQEGNHYFKDGDLDVMEIIEAVVLDGSDEIDLSNSDLQNKELLSIEVYAMRPILDDAYTLFCKSKVAITNRDFALLTFVFGISIIFVVVPLMLYLITLILSIVQQRRSIKVLYLDTVTSEKNWLYFEERAESLLKKNKRRKKLSYAMISLRLDKFQSYCMCYGPKEGDILLEAIGGSLKRQMNKKECCARYAESEYGLLLSYNNTDQLKERLRDIVDVLFKQSKGRKIDFSCGIYLVEDEIDVDALYNNASIARKTISHESVKRIAFYDEKLKEEQLWERHVEERMEDALKKGEFKVYLQPKYNASTEKIGGAEALIRWISDEEGFIGPGKFIPIFEKNGFITKIDDFMLESVSKLQAKWYKEGKKLVPISVNVSRAHFTRDDLAEHICQIVENANAPKEYIELELTESAFFEDTDVLINTVKKLRDYGFKVSMDDFGADYSSLNSLKDLPLDVIKLDAGFFRGKEETEERGSVIVEGVIQLAKHLDMHIVAEGIEHREQVDFLANAGCDLIQGFYFAKPMPVEEYEKLN